MIHRVLALWSSILILVSGSGCGASDEDPANLISIALLQETLAGPVGTNLAQVKFDNLSLLVDQSVTSCDSDNSSGAGIQIALSGPFAGASVAITSVPQSSPFTFPDNGALDLRLPGSHLPDGSGTCVLTRTANTALRYQASLSSSCVLYGHTMQVLDIDCRPN